MFIGRYISCDEQDIGLQVQHKDKQRVTFKKVGEGFLLDSLFADGYIYSFYFSNQAVPKSWIDKRLSPLHARVVILLQQLPFDAKIFYVVWIIYTYPPIFQRWNLMRVVRE